MDKYEQRRRAVAALIDGLGYGGTAKVARAIGKAPDYVSRMLYEPDKPGRKRIGEDTWDALVMAYPDALAAPLVPAPRAPGAAASVLAGRLLAVATPRSRRALERIIAAAEAGRLTEADLLLLESIAQHLAAPTPAHNMDAALRAKAQRDAAPRK